ncbi:LysR family transcriptional regulator [Yersinia massiliensis]|uniref:LysR family transcriptional regulator n=1 Tax=Yersinia massiliensis TaxID=419257 RepID=UPI0011A6F578|nr:LysR family transcriptional regulator [Yersinia massiliensis]
MKDKISLDDLNLFVSVVGAGSLTKVSETADIPLPTLSRRLTKLEQCIGGRLLNRSTRTITLTPLGRMYYDSCAGPLSECLSATTLLDDYHHSLTGKLVITAPINLTHQWVGDCIFNFMKKYPEISIDLMVTNRVIDLESLNIDAAIRVGKLKDSNWIAKKIMSSHYVFCASIEYLSKNSVPLVPSDLVNQHKLIMPRSDTEWQITNKSSNSEYVISAAPYMVVDDTELIIRAAKNNLGICLAPFQFVKSLIERGELVHILPEWHGGIRPTYIMFRDRDYVPARLRAFISHVEKYEIIDS